MIIYEGGGSLFDTKLQTITCPCNTVGVMGNGLALAMRNKVKGLFTFYQEVCKSGLLVVGKPLVYPVPGGKHQVLLFPTKEDWKNNSKIEYLDDGLAELAKNYKEWGITELGIPPLGCGYGGLDYIKSLKPLLKKHLEEIELPVSVYLYNRSK